MALEGFDLSRLVRNAVGGQDEVMYTDVDLRPVGRVSLEEVQAARDVYLKIVGPIEDASESDVIHRQLVYTVGMMALGLVPDLGKRVVAKLGDDVRKLKKRRTDLFIGSAWKSWVIRAMYEAWLEGIGR